MCVCVGLLACGSSETRTEREEGWEEGFHVYWQAAREGGRERKKGNCTKKYERLK